MTAPDLDALIEHLLDAERRLIAAFARVGVANGTLADMRLLTNAAIALRKQGDALVQLREENARLRAGEEKLRYLLIELVAQVRGECPSLLNEDSGGDARLSMAIDDAITEGKK